MLVVGGIRNGKTLEMMESVIDKALQNYHVMVLAPSPFKYADKISKMLSDKNIAYRIYGGKYGILIKFDNFGWIQILKKAEGE